MLRTFAFFICLSFCANVGFAQDKDPVKEIRDLNRKGDHEKALELADKFIKDEPKKAIAYYIRGEIYASMRKPNDAIKDFEKAFEIDNKFFPAINQRGGERFKLGMIKESIEDFDKYIEANPKGFEDHWRRGISLYYAGRFEDGAKQFLAGEKVYGNDVENAFWHYLCNARAGNVAKARKDILKIGRDGRIPMMKVYDLIQGKAKPQEVLDNAEKAKLEPADKTEALFYAHLYVGLNYEAEGNKAKAKEHLTTAVEKYKISHYMWDVGNVHLMLLKKADGK